VGAVLALAATLVVGMALEVVALRRLYGRDSGIAEPAASPSQGIAARNTRRRRPRRLACDLG